MSTTTAKTLDLKGLACPLPIAKTAQGIRKTAQGIRELRSGELIEALATDPGSVPDFAAWCRATGNKLVEQSDDGDTCRCRGGRRSRPAPEARDLRVERGSRQGVADADPRDQRGCDGDADDGVLHVLGALPPRERRGQDHRRKLDAEAAVDDGPTGPGAPEAGEDELRRRGAGHDEEAGQGS